MKDSEDIRCGRNPFTVPEGYFDSLNSRIMERIDAVNDTRTQSARIIPLKRFHIMRWAAVFICAISFGAVTYLNIDHNNDKVASVATTTEQYDDLTEAANYAMISNQDAYYMLSQD